MIAKILESKTILFRGPSQEQIIVEQQDLIINRSKFVKRKFYWGTGTSSEYSKDKRKAQGLAE